MVRRSKVEGIGVPTPRILNRAIDNQQTSQAANILAVSDMALNGHIPPRLPSKVNPNALKAVRRNFPTNQRMVPYPVQVPVYPSRTEHTERKLSGLSAAASLAGPEAALAAEVASGVMERASTIIGSLIQAGQNPIIKARRTIVRRTKKETITDEYSGSLTPFALLGAWIISGGPERVMTAYKSSNSGNPLSWAPGDMGALYVGGPVGYGLKKLGDWWNSQNTSNKNNKDNKSTTNDWWKWTQV